MTATVGGHILTTAGRARSELEAVARRLAFPVGLGTSVAVKRVAPAHANEGVAHLHVVPTLGAVEGQGGAGADQGGGDGENAGGKGGSHTDVSCGTGKET